MEKRVIFGIRERIILLGVLPSESNIITLRIIKDLRDKLSFSNEELEICGISTNSGSISWSNESEKEIAFSAAEMSLVLDEFKKKDENKKMTLELLGIYDKLNSI